MLLIALIIFLSSPASLAGSTSVQVVIINQRHHLHEKKAIALQEISTQQVKLYPQLNVEVEVATLSFPHLSYWTYLPLFELYQEFKKDWLLVVDEFTSINWSNFLHLLDEVGNASFVGCKLQDRNPLIIHHFTEPQNAPPYFDTRPGVMFAGDLVRSAGKKATPEEQLRNKFVIDAAFELSDWLHSVAGVSLHHSDRFCRDKTPDASGCAIIAVNSRVCEPVEVVDTADLGLHVAVKTCSGYHSSRLKVLRKTWLKTANNYTLFSDITDHKLGTVSVGVPNTERGHCAKFTAILKLALEKRWRWLLIADDDTLLSLPRLMLLLSCYSPDEKLALGEVYGYVPGHYLMPYPTGGSGIVLSHSLVEAIVDSPWCQCRAPDEPDDMMIGLCLHRLGLSILHVRDMHQNPPLSYASGRLEGSVSISFHGHWQGDPVKEYRRWLLNSGPLPGSEDSDTQTRDGALNTARDEL